MRAHTRALTVPVRRPECVHSAVSSSQLLALLSSSWIHNATNTTLWQLCPQYWQPAGLILTEWHPVKPRLHDTTCCQTGCQTSCHTGLTTACIVYTAGCQTGYTTRFDNRLNEQWLFVQPGWTNSGCLFNTVVKPVWQLVWQPAVSCKQTSNRLSNLLTTGLTTGWMPVYKIQPVVKPVVQQVWQPAVSCKWGIRRWLQSHVQHSGRNRATGTDVGPTAMRSTDWSKCGHTMCIRSSCQGQGHGNVARFCATL